MRVWFLPHSPHVHVAHRRTGGLFLVPSGVVQVPGEDAVADRPERRAPPHQVEAGTMNSQPGPRRTRQNEHDTAVVTREGLNVVACEIPRRRPQSWLGWFGLLITLGEKPPSAKAEKQPTKNKQFLVTDHINTKPQNKTKRAENTALFRSTTAAYARA